MVDNDKEKTDKAVQSYAALGVGLVCIIIGVPLWWKTTEVYRVSLPYNEIAELVSYKVEYAVDFAVVVFDEKSNHQELIKFSDELKNALETKDLSETLNVVYRGKVRPSRPEEKEAYLDSKTIEDFDQLLTSLASKDDMGKYVIGLIPSDSHIHLNRSLVGRHRNAYIPVSNDVRQVLTKILQIVQKVFNEKESLIKTFLLTTGAKHDKVQIASTDNRMSGDKSSMRSVRSHPGYEVTFTLMNPQPEILDIQWDIKGAISSYLSQLQKEFSPYVEISSKSQYLFYTGIGSLAQKSQQADYYELTYDSLPHIINPIEAYLNSHVSTRPNLNFVVYVPMREQAPLRILDQNGVPVPNNAFLSPRWGGIQVHNVLLPGNATLPHPINLEMKGVMETVLSQLRLLLGVGITHSSSELVIEHPGNAAITQWELDGWLRKRCIENVASATKSLSSLAQLLEEIGNIVINDDIGTEVEKAVTAIKDTHKYLARGKLKAAFLSSRSALRSAETAFFDPSLLELLYFPEDQKFAIYIPLFLPISIPVVLSSISALKWMFGKEKEKND